MRKISTLMLVSSAGLLLSTTAYAYDCSQLTPYTNGATYANGAKVKNVNKAFSCTVGGWCSVGGPYEPDVGWAASNAWAELGACDVATTQVALHFPVFPRPAALRPQVFLRLAVPRPPVSLHPAVLHLQVNLLPVPHR